MASDRNAAKDEGVAVDYEYVGDAAPRRQRGSRIAFSAGLALVAASVLAAAVWAVFAEREDAAAPPPLVRVDPAPVKVRPEEPGGMAIPHRDKFVFDSVRGKAPPTKVERLMPPPETPMTVTERRAAAMVAPAAGNAAAEPPLAKAPAKKQMAPPPVPTATAKLPAQPKTAAKPPIPKTAALPAAGPAPPPAPPATAPRTVPAARPSPPPSPPKAQPRAAKATTMAGAYRLQLAAVRSEAAARREWQRVRKGNADLLGSMIVIVRRADLGAKGVFFRLQIGPLPTRDAARALCAKLKARKLACFIVKS